MRHNFYLFLMKLSFILFLFTYYCYISGLHFIDPLDSSSGFVSYIRYICKEICDLFHAINTLLFIGSPIDIIWLQTCDISFITFIAIVFVFCVINPKSFSSFAFSKIVTYLSLFVFFCQGCILLHCFGPRVVYYNESFESSNFIVSCKLLILILAFGCLFVSIDYFKEKSVARFEYPLLVIIAVYGMFILVSTRDLFFMAIGFELQTLSYFVMAALYRYSNLGAEGSMKYYILGSFSSAIIFFGISLIYSFGGSCNFSVLEILMHSKIYGEYSLLGSNPPMKFNYYTHRISLAGLNLGFYCFVVGIFFKLGIVPFHFWMPDVYAATPPVVSNFFAVVPKIVFILVLIRVLSQDLNIMLFGFSDILRFLGVISILYGGVCGLYSIQLRRLIAYAAIAQAGFTILIFSLNSYNCIEACFIFFIVYSFILMNIFTIIRLYTKTPAYQELQNMSEFTSFLYTNPYLAFNMAISLLSLAGTPPLSGFFTKILMIETLNNEGYYFLAMITILLTLVTIVFYVRIMVVVWFHDKTSYAKSDLWVEEYTPLVSNILVITTMISLFLFWEPHFFFFVVSEIIKSVLGHGRESEY